MVAEEEIKSRIPAFSGYASELTRVRADEEIRAYAGERLAQIPAAALAALGAEARARYDRLLLRAEFVNQPAFREFSECATPRRIDALLAANALVLHAADALGTAALDQALQSLEEAFDSSDAAMTLPA